MVRNLSALILCKNTKECQNFQLLLIFFFRWLEVRTDIIEKYQYKFSDVSSCIIKVCIQFNLNQIAFTPKNLIGCQMWLSETQLDDTAWGISIFHKKHGDLYIHHSITSNSFSVDLTFEYPNFHYDHNKRYYDERRKCTGNVRICNNL